MSYRSKYFAEQEFVRCTPSCKMSDMDEQFLRKLDKIRERAGIPLLLTCAYRTRQHDLNMGRSGNSAHTKGLAVDIRCNASITRAKIIEAAMFWGITRIGIGKTFVHIDADQSLPQHVIWHYYD